MVNQDFRWLPEVGEPVSVEWGLESVAGRVVEAYASGAQPRVVVEIEPGVVSDEPVTVTLPLRAVQPLASDSRWSQAALYEKSVAEALLRVLSASGAHIQRHPNTAPEADVLVRMPNGQRLLVEAKRSLGRISARDVEHTIDQLQKYTQDDPHVIALLIMDQDLPVTWTARRLHDIAVTTWRGSEDDDRLRDSLQRLVGLAG